MSSPTDDWEPLDKSIGWKWWDQSTDRWWQGTQWSETYRKYDEPRPQENPSTIGLPIKIDSVELTDEGIVLKGQLPAGYSFPKHFPTAMSIYGGQTTTPYSINKKEE